MAKYKFKYIKCFDSLVEKKEKEKELKLQKKSSVIIKKETHLVQDKNDITKIKDLDNINSKSTWGISSPNKIIMTLKDMKEEDIKNFNPATFLEKINKDFRLFAEFFDGFKEGSSEPFTKQYACVLGDNFVGTYINKFNTALEILKASKKDLLELIKSNYKEYFHGTEGKILMEVLLCARKDASLYLKNPSEKKMMSDMYDARIG